MCRNFNGHETDKDKVFPVLNWAQRQEGTWNSGGIAPRILIMALNGGRCIRA
jgi:hypothetical protein